MLCMSDSRHEPWLGVGPLPALGAAIFCFCCCLAPTARAQNAPAPGVSTPAAIDSSVVPPLPKAAHEPSGEPVPELRDVIALARLRGPDAVVAAAGVRSAGSTYAGARLGAVGNPYLELTTSRGTEGATKGLSFNAALWLPLELAGQRRARVAEVDAAVGMAEAVTAVARASAASDAVRAFGSVAIATAKVKTAEEILKTSRDEALIFEARVAAKDSTKADLTLALVEVARNGVALTEARADLWRALGDLARATGAEGYVPTPVPLEPPGGEPRTRLDEVPLVDLSRKEMVYHRRAANRHAKDASPPASLMVQAGRGDLGETRWTLGVAWTFPVLRVNQGERARAHADAERAGIERDTRQRALSAHLRGLLAERKELRSAIVSMSEGTLPTARAAVEAAVETHRAGKTEVLRVFAARRDLALLRLRQLELMKREWEIVAEMVRITGELP